MISPVLPGEVLAAIRWRGSLSAPEVIHIGDQCVYQQGLAARSERPLRPSEVLRLIRLADVPDSQYAGVG
jgi:hypothetical protein